MADAPVAVITVTLNSAATVARCLNVFRESAEPFYTVVVDNHSHDDTVQKLRRLGLADAVIGNDRNRGYGAAVNQALAHLRDEDIGPSAIVLLDPDCFIAPDDLLKLTAVLHDTPQLGAVSPVLLSADGVEQVTAHRFRTVRSEIRRVFNETPIDVLTRRLSPDLHLTDWVVGACLVLRPQAIETIGGICERYFVYVEDIDTCHRLRTAGWWVAIDTSVSVTHIGGHSLSSSRIVDFAPVLKLINELDFYESVHGRSGRAVIALLRVARQLRKGEVRCSKTLILLLAGLGLTARRIGRAFLRRQDISVRAVIPACWLTARRHQ
ncbi:hypothetical protein Pth03_44680 [Planotetraspora thailandica]|uniref:Glycosyltransferase 2-like domain-containing protein n=1 Tax=Planotetraspora thailandica TaxID=487172 RepID=A0A8J3V1N1_9ACTN|nr:glycosyltransferase family 2 protein [Planotetraspora thailandica]GII56079.1 hypothetical protein Pth03_44680 [Planotetraspora thailandica]